MMMDLALERRGDKAIRRGFGDGNASDWKCLPIRSEASFLLQVKRETNVDYMSL